MSTDTEVKKPAGPTLRTVSELLGLFTIMQSDSKMKQLARDLQAQRAGYHCYSKTAKGLAALPRKAPLIEITDQLPYNTVSAGVRMYWLPGGGELLGGRSRLTSLEEVLRLGGEAVPCQNNDIRRGTREAYSWYTDVHLLGTAFPEGTKLSPIEMAKDLYFLVNMEKGKPYLAGWYPGHTPLRKFTRFRPHSNSNLLISMHCRSEVKVDRDFLLEVPLPEVATEADWAAADELAAEVTGQEAATPPLQPLPIPPAPERVDDWDDDEIEYDDEDY